MVNGGSTATSHSVGVFSSTERSAKKTSSITVKGGVVAGGFSSNGAGGIDAKSGSRVILNNVTIAGCKAEQNWGSDGYGGGIYVNNSETSVSGLTLEGNAGNA